MICTQQCATFAARPRSLSDTRRLPLATLHLAKSGGCARLGLRVSAEVLPLRRTPGAPFELDCCIAAPTLYSPPARKARQGIETWRQLAGARLQLRKQVRLAAYTGACSEAVGLVWQCLPVAIASARKPFKWGVSTV